MANYVFKYFCFYCGGCDGHKNTLCLAAEGLENYIECFCSEDLKAVSDLPIDIRVYIHPLVKWLTVAAQYRNSVLRRAPVSSSYC
jgi:hypothetical protein